MKEKALMILAVAAISLIVIGLNAASYSSKPQQADTELSPNRSTYNPGSTGTKALFNLLTESGIKATRYSHSASDLPSGGGKGEFGTLVMVGPMRREIEDEEYNHILDWVNMGGRLIIVDRSPAGKLLVTTSPFKLSFMGDMSKASDMMSVDPAVPSTMTANTEAIRPEQPSVINASINAVQPSIFASTINFTYDASLDEDREEIYDGDYDAPANTGNGAGIGDNEDARPPSSEPPPTTAKTPIRFESAGRAAMRNLMQAPPPPPMMAKPSASPTPYDFKDIKTIQGKELKDIRDDTHVEEVSQISDNDPAILDAPIIHIGAKDKAYVTEVPYGGGRIFYVTDPYIFANGGIALADNAQLAINLFGDVRGVAFDEYHHGFLEGRSRLVEYFAGTPVVAIFVQIIVLAGLILFSRSRRFARALPDDTPDRLSKLEYVQAMAELQRRTNSYDLAVENIYRDLKRRAIRQLGLGSGDVTRADLAKAIAARLERPMNEVDAILFRAEDISYGEKATRQQIIELVRQLREIEASLGLRRTKR